MEVSGVGCQVSGKKHRSRNLNTEILRFGAWNLLFCNYYENMQKKFYLING